MFSYVRTVFLCAVLAAINQVASAQNQTSDPSAGRASVINGHPCVAELCIGDDLRALGSIAWDPINVTNDGYIGPILAFPHGRSPIATNAGIVNTLLATQTYCDPKGAWYFVQLHDVLLSYKSRSGFPTEVWFQVVPSEDQRGLHFIVAEVRRRLLTENQTSLSPAQVDATRAEIGRRYASVPPDQAKFWTDSSGDPWLLLFRPYDENERHRFRDQLRANPQCSKAVRID